MTAADPRPSTTPSATPSAAPVAAPVRSAREVRARLVLDVSSTADLSLLVAAARTPGWDVDDALVVTLDGGELPRGARPVEVPSGPEHRGERMHVLTGVPAGRVVVEYSARVGPVDDGGPVVDLRGGAAAAERFEMNRPSRYCPSDEMASFAAREFGTRAERSDVELADAVTAWVRERLTYTAGSSTAFDGAVQTLLRGQGVCRDYAHLVVALARALELPARLTAVYAPGLSPMDFHAVAEVRVSEPGREPLWQVHDATGLAPRTSLVRISSGRDAADTAFLTSLRGGLLLREMHVSAVVEGDLPLDDGGRTVLD